MAIPHGVLLEEVENYQPDNFLAVSGNQVACSDEPTEHYNVYIDTLTSYNTKLTMACNHEPSIIYVFSRQPGDAMGYNGKYYSPYIKSIYQTGYYYWDCHACPADYQGGAECYVENLEWACKNDTAKQKCYDQEWWGSESPCPEDYYCDLGVCVDAYPDRPDWVCNAWGECQDSGIQNRYCYDSKNTGSLQNMPATTQSCTPVPELYFILKGHIQDQSGSIIPGAIVNIKLKSTGENVATTQSTTSGLYAVTLYWDNPQTPEDDGIPMTNNDLEINVTSHEMISEQTFDISSVQPEDIVHFDITVLSTQSPDDNGNSDDTGDSSNPGNVNNSSDSNSTAVQEDENGCTTINLPTGQIEVCEKTALDFVKDHWKPITAIASVIVIFIAFVLFIIFFII